jgi:hypothetical protein
MTKIALYPTTIPAPNDIVIGSDVGSGDATKNFTIQSIMDLVPGGASWIPGDGIDLTGTTISVDLLLNGGLIFNAGEVQVNLSAPSMFGFLTTSYLKWNAYRDANPTSSPLYGDYIACSSANHVCTLPTAIGAAATGLVIKFQTITVPVAMTIEALPGEDINGAATIALTNQWETVTLTSNGFQWLATAV